jgi:hypothetical protein
MLHSPPSLQDLDELPTPREWAATLVLAVAMAAGVFGAVLLLQPWVLALMAG